MMRVIPVQKSVGTVLCHDITRIAPGESKGRAFKKGHVIRHEDVPVLLELGKEHLYVLSLEEGRIHENEAAERIATAAAGQGLRFSEVSEGRINLIADTSGLLVVDVEGLSRVNSEEGVVLASSHTHQRVHTGKAVAGTRVVPLVIEEQRIEAVERICREVREERGPIIQVKPFTPMKVGVVTTGSEIYHGRIKDAFGPVIRKKLASYGSSVIHQAFVSDDPEMTVAAIRDVMDRGAELVLCTGGMSVDPDDQTPTSIRNTGAEVVTYGSPTFPGAMFMLAYLGEVPILGLPGCVMYYNASIFELVLPRILAGEKLTRQDIVAMGHGGFCNGCDVCRFPVCPFGKGA